MESVSTSSTTPKSVASELITDAYRRSEGAIELTVKRHKRYVRIEVQRIIVSAGADAEQLDDSRSVTAIYRCPQGGALLLRGHVALRSVAPARPKSWHTIRAVRRAGCGPDPRREAPLHVL